jgi:hypothetical protein
MSNSTNYEIVSGLNEGELVVLSSNGDLHDGSEVRPSETK